MKLTKKQFLSVLVCLGLLATVLVSVTPRAQGDNIPGLGHIRHVVLFKLKQDVTPEQQKSLKDAAAKLKN